MQISEAASLCNMSIDTIRYYERSGLLPRIDRDKGGNRSFSPENIEWLRLLASLRDTGMTMKRMQYFRDLYREGDATLRERHQVLSEHNDDLERKRASLDSCAALLKTKMSMYVTRMEESP